MKLSLVPTKIRQYLPIIFNFVDNVEIGVVQVISNLKIDKTQFCRQWRIFEILDEALKLEINAKRVILNVKIDFFQNRPAVELSTILKFLPGAVLFYMEFAEICTMLNVHFAISDAGLARMPSTRTSEIIDWLVGNTRHNT